MPVTRTGTGMTTRERERSEIIKHYDEMMMIF
jgi:hypothetical protein